jgi:uncharacterized membrane protein
VVVVVLFALSWYLRRGQTLGPPTTPIVLSFIGVTLLVITGWMGGELVDRLGVGVDDGAHLDAPNSITHRSTTGGAGPRPA